MSLETRCCSQFSLDIDPLRSEFVHDVTEFRFLTDTLAETQSQLRVALFFCSSFYLAFTLTDVAVLGYLPSFVSWPHPNAHDFREMPLALGER